MEPTKTIQDKKDKNHSIEFGTSTWNPKVMSIRNRYNLETGQFNKAGSSEVPFKDFKMMINESIINNFLTNEDLKEILEVIASRIAK